MSNLVSVCASSTTAMLRRLAVPDVLHGCVQRREQKAEALGLVVPAALEARALREPALHAPAACGRHTTVDRAACALGWRRTQRALDRACAEDRPYCSSRARTNADGGVRVSVGARRSSLLYSPPMKSMAQHVVMCCSMLY